MTVDRTLSGLALDPIYEPPGGPPPEIGRPGEYPYTRGVYETMYRGRLWTRRQQSGFGSPEESNELFKYLLRIGQTGLNMDADVATKLGLNPDYPLAQGDVGLQGTSLCTYEDMKALFKDIPLDRISSTLIFPPPTSPILMGQYLLMAREHGIPWEKLIGTIMNCPFTQLVGPTFQANTDFFPIDLALKIGLDLIEYLVPRAPRWTILNVNSRNIRESGVDAIQEAAFEVIHRQLALDERQRTWNWLALSQEVLDGVYAEFRRLPLVAFVRTGDAIHLECARRNGFEEIFSSDRHLLDAAKHFRLQGHDVTG
jgi:methylmalonyl-CoA mutase cobalamin-binding domain/chain